MFDLNKLATPKLKEDFKKLSKNFETSVEGNRVTSEKTISTLVISLATARTRNNPLEISFPFKSVFVETTTSATTNCNIIPLSNDSYQDEINIKLGDSVDFDYGVSKLFLTNLAQSGASITLKFFTNCIKRSNTVQATLLNEKTYIHNAIGFGNNVSAQNDLKTVIWEGFANVLASGAVVSGSMVYPNTTYRFLDTVTNTFFVQTLTTIANILGYEIEVIDAVTTSDGNDCIFSIFTGANTTTSTTATLSALRLELPKSKFAVGSIYQSFIKVDALNATAYTNALAINTRTFVKKHTNNSMTVGSVKIRIMYRF